MAGVLHTPLLEDRSNKIGKVIDCYIFINELEIKPCLQSSFQMTPAPVLGLALR